MTTTYVNIQSIQEFQDRMQILGQNADDFIQRSMYMALRGDVATEIRDRTPMSIKERYYYDYNKDTGKFKPNKSKRAKFGVPGTLRKSGPSSGPQIKGTDEIIIGATAPYAIFVHEAKKPVEGHYWEPGEKRGWTTKGTGNKFISGPLERHADDIPDWAVKQLDKLMQQAGIF